MQAHQALCGNAKQSWTINQSTLDNDDDDDDGYIIVDKDVPAVNVTSADKNVDKLLKFVADNDITMVCDNVLALLLMFRSMLTLSPPITLMLYTLPYWSNPPFLISDIQTLWRSGLSARVPECQKL